MSILDRRAVSGRSSATELGMNPEIVPNMRAHALVLLRQFMRVAPSPVLRPFEPQRAPLVRLSRWLFTIAVIAFVAMLYGAAFAILPPSFYLFMMAPIAIMGLVVIWALPERDHLPTNSITKLFLTLIVVTLLWPNYLSISLPGLPWISMRRLVLAPIDLILLIGLSTSPSFRKLLKDIVTDRPLFLKLLMGYTIAQLLSIPFGHGLGDELKTLVNSWLTWTLVFFSSAYVFSMPKTVERWSLLLVFSTLLICMEIFPEMRLQHVLWAEHIPSFLAVDDPVVQKMLAGGYRSGAYRVQSTFTASLTLSEYCSLVSPFLLHYFFRTKSIFARGLLILFDLLLLTTIIHTQSRTGMVGMIITHAAFGLILAIRTWRADRSSLLAPAAVLAYPLFMVALAGAIMTVPGIHNRVLGSSATDSSDQARKDQWRLGIPKIIKHPLGHGPGEGGSALGYTNLAGEATVDSYWLNVFLDYGFGGFVCFFGLLGYAAYRATIIASRHPTGELSLALPVATAIMAFIVTRYVLILTDNMTLIMMMVGMVVALDYRDRQLSKRTDVRPA